MTNNKDDEQNNKDEEQKQTSEKPKLKDTRGIYLGNHYDKLSMGHNLGNETSACFYCPKCKISFSSRKEEGSHECNK
jgi:hypothetical protein